MSKHLEAKKRHHHVWANYLSRWGNGTKNVFYSTKNGNIAHDSVRGIAVDDYFYKTTHLESEHVEVIKSFSQKCPSHLQQLHTSFLDSILTMQQAEADYRKSGIQNQIVEQSFHALKCNALENLHASFENGALPVLEALAQENLDVLQDTQNMIAFTSFLGQQIWRTKTYRDSILLHLPRRSNMECELVDATAHVWWFLSYMLGLNTGASFYFGRTNNRHSLLLNKTSVPFITSDQPVVNVHSCVSETVFGAPEHGDFYYPISPKVAYIICDSERFTSGKNEIDESTAQEFNTKMAAQALTHIIGNTKNSIEPFMSYIGRRHQRLNTK